MDLSDIKLAILAAIDSLESCVVETIIDDATEQEWEAQSFNEYKVADALKALQALEWEDE